MCALMAWSLERMIAWHHSGRPSVLITAAILVGLATGAKYPGAVMLIPMAWIVWDKQRGHGLGLWLRLAGLAALVFVFTTPYALLDPREFWRDFSFEAGHAAGGHFGSLGQRSFPYVVSTFSHNLGWLAVLLLPLSLWQFARNAAHRALGIGLWLTFLCFAAPVSMAHIDAERYVLPVIVVGALLTAVAAVSAILQAPRTNIRLGLSAALFAAVLPVLAEGSRLAAGGGDTTQLEARRWCEAHLPREALLVQEAYAARLVSDTQKQDVMNNAAYQHASPEMRARLDNIAAYHVVTLPLLVAGKITSNVEARGQPAIELEVVPQASALNGIFYDACLYASADYFMTSGGVRARFASDPARYPREAAFYRELDEHSDRVATFTPRGTVV